ncbi:MAG TPA: MoxR family ATPase [Micromonospora sp.]
MADASPGPADARARPPDTAGTNHDRRDGRVYVSDERIDLAVAVALATGRPLLLRGEPGSGKSSLAAYVARTRGWRYYEHVVTARTLAEEFLWSFDHVRRMAEMTKAVQHQKTVHDSDYVTPGVLWWAFDRESARCRGAGRQEPARLASEGPPPPVEPRADLNADREDTDDAVVLIDEIDKADPDTPNGLLVPLGSRQFTVAQTGTVVRDPGLSPEPPQRLTRHLVIVTTNGERDLPAAFLRRCVVHELEPPGPEKLVDIAAEHLRTYGEGFTAADLRLAEELAAELMRFRERATAAAVRAPSTAEFLDALHACRQLGIRVGDERWTALSELTLVKGNRWGA